MEATSVQSECKKRLRLLRESAGYSQARFAECFNITTEAYRRIEVGPVSVPIEILYSLKEKFGISTDFLIYGDTDTYDTTWIDFQVYIKKEITEIQRHLEEYSKQKIKLQTRYK